MGLQFGDSPQESPARETLRSGGTRNAPFSVEQLVVSAHRALETQLPALWVEGEVSGLRRPSSGHLYFTLKDERASIPVAMWRSSAQRLRFRLDDGQKLRVFGRVGIYAAQGKFQLYAEKAEPAGIGDLMAELERRKAQLAAEGLFAIERKRALPKWPRTVGIVTSASGAAIHDICEVIGRRCPTHLLLAPAIVQGKGAAESLILALRRLSRQPDVDVIILGRGGGSMEDLWCFNDEQLVREVARCPVPVVSAVGHEIDVTLVDLVADERAATPSQAGELVVPEWDEAWERIETSASRLRLAMKRRVMDRRADLERVSRKLAQAGRTLLTQEQKRIRAAEMRLRAIATSWGPERRERISVLHQRLLVLHPKARLSRHRLNLQTFDARLERLTRRKLESMRARLEHASGKLDALSPLRVLGRGFALATKTGTTDIIRDAASLREGESMDLQFARGRARATIDHIDTGDKQ